MVLWPTVMKIQDKGFLEENQVWMVVRWSCDVEGWE